VGLISDTHGLLRPQAQHFLRGSDRIVHGGDIGSPGVLEALAALAPVTAVRGNNDQGAWADSLPQALSLRLGDVVLHVLHDLAELDVDLRSAGVAVVVSGHSHRPLIQARDGVLYVNPGSAGPRRFRLPVTVAELLIDGAAVTPRIVDLGVGSGG
jgi:hypothetical protein